MLHGWNESLFRFRYKQIYIYIYWLWNIHSLLIIIGFVISSQGVELRNRLVPSSLPTSYYRNIAI